MFVIKWGYACLMVRFCEFEMRAPIVAFVKKTLISYVLMIADHVFAV